MARTKIYNPSASPLTLPLPLRGVLLPGEAAVSSLTKAQLRTLLGASVVLTIVSDGNAVTAGLESAADLLASKITGSGAPTVDSDLTSKEYVDDAVEAGVAEAVGEAGEVLFNLAPTIAPAALEESTNNWAPTGLATASVVRMDATGPIEITGLTGGASGRVVTLVHVGSTALNTISLTHLDGDSDAANQFSLPGEAAIEIPIGGAVMLWYDVTSTKWRPLSQSL